MKTGNILEKYIKVSYRQVHLSKQFVNRRIILRDN